MNRRQQGRAALQGDEEQLGGALTETVATNNTTASVNADSTVAGYVTYDPKNGAFTGRQSNCVKTTALDFTNDAGPGSLFP